MTSNVASYFHYQNTLFTLKNPVVEHFMLKTLAGQLHDSVQLVTEEVVFVILMVVCTVYIFFVIINIVG